MRRNGGRKALGTRAAIALSLLAPLLGFAPAEAGAHSGLVDTDPPIGASLGAAPEAVRLTFSERPEPSLSEIGVVDADGEAVQSGKAAPVAGNSLALEVPVRRLERGVYTVNYDVLSAVDGHDTVGRYSFGVLASPGTAAAATSTTTEANPSALELIARWIFLIGLVALLGASVAGVARFGGSSGTDLLLAAAGWSASVVGLALLTEAQRQIAGSSIGDLLDTAIGDALVWRAVAIGVAGLALLVAAWRPRIRRAALGLAAVAAVGAIVAHVDAGHAGSGDWSAAITVAAQSAHFAAVGIWFGGLAALLLGIRGEPSAEKTASVRRFAIAAAAALIVVVATGTLRAIDELTSFEELLTTGYGRAVLAKIVLIALIAALALRNRRRGQPAADRDLGPLRRTSRAELALAVTALAVASVLGVLAPPVVSKAPAASSGIQVTGTDPAGTVAVDLSVASPEPGPNTFEARIQDQSGAPLAADEVTLEFDPLDDPGVPGTTLNLMPAGAGLFSATGDDLKFDGRWGVTAVIERDGDEIEVPLELEVPGLNEPQTVFRPPGELPEYTVQLASNAGFIRVIPDPEQAGPSRLRITVFTVFSDVALVEGIVVTHQAGTGTARRLDVRRLTSGRFSAGALLEAGRNEITVVANPGTRSRVRAVFELEIPPG